MNDTVRVIIVISVIALALVLLLYWERKSVSRLAIENPPWDVQKQGIGKSSVERRLQSNVVDSIADVVFETESVKTVPLGIPQRTQLDATLVSLGDPRTIDPSSGMGASGRFELHVWFYVHNLSHESIVLKDIKAQVYHVSMYRIRPAAIAWAPRVELAMDNTADLGSIREPLPAGEAQAVDLVLETSVFDTLFTTLVFGLIIYYSNVNGENRLFEIPSDKIFIFQHDHHWGASKSHFVARNEDDLNQIQAEVGKGQEFFDSLRQIYRIHTLRHSEN